MISFGEAYEIVISSAFGTSSERISFMASEGRILAEDVLSDMDMPPFKRAAVDGYACRKEDLDSDLEIIELIAAGRVPLKNAGKGQCSKIMTGAIVPENCDIVFMVEDSEILPSGMVRFTSGSMKSNISLKGEDIKAGDVVLQKGKLIKPQDIAVMAAVGHVEVLVRKQPGIGIISTGDELVEPYEKPGNSRIRNSNAYQLLSQVHRAGGKGTYYGIVPDTGDLPYKMIAKAINDNDIVILTGGVSMGDFDQVPAYLQKAGVSILFDKVNVQPGKPTTFGVHPKCLIFGLPGNPVSSFVQFETLVRPLMDKMMDNIRSFTEHEMNMGVRFERKSSSRMGWIPVRILQDREVVPVEYHGSAHIAALSEADGIISMDQGVSVIEKGESVKMRYI